MTYDLIMVADSSYESMRPVTQNAILSARSETKDINVIFIETGFPYAYSGIDRYINLKTPFNYNGALNEGLQYRENEFQILSNNDVIFRPGWSDIGRLMKENGYLSASAISNDRRQHQFRKGKLYEGYRIGYELSGWCIFTHRDLWDKIGKLDETYTFWYSDNMYAGQLWRAGIKHALFADIRVDHLGSQTLKKVPRNKRFIYTNKDIYAKRKDMENIHPQDSQKEL